MLLARFALSSSTPATTYSRPTRTSLSSCPHLAAVHRRLHSGYYSRPDVTDFVARRLLVPLLAPEPPMA